MTIRKIVLLIAFIGLSGWLNRGMAQSDSTGKSKDSAQVASPLTGGGGGGLGGGGCPSTSASAISASTTNICSGTTVTFSVTSNGNLGSGVVQTFNWLVNGTSVQNTSSSPFKTSALNNGDKVQCDVVVNPDQSGCPTYSNASNTITMTVTAAAGMPSIPSGSTSICQGSGATAYTTSATNATSYTWSLSPSTAGTISGSSTTGTVTWSSSYSGTASISVVANGCSGASSAASATVTVSPTVGVPSTPSGPGTLCQASGSSAYTTSATNATNYSWSISPSGAGTISGTGTSGTVSWNSSFSGSATISVTASGCNGPTAAASTTVSITPSVASPAAPSGSTSLCQGSTPVVYTTGAVSNATGYTWSISPSSAGTISGSATSGTVTWSSSFSGAALVGVVATGCNAATTPVTTTVTVQAMVGAVSAPSGPAVINNNGTANTYAATAANATGYNWSTLSPAEAGSMAVTGGTAVVTWNPLYAGSVVLSVSATGCGGPTAAATTTITVYQPLSGGVVTPGALTITSGSDPGLLTASGATGGNCNGSYSYQWLQSTNGTSFSNADGSSTGENYDPGVLSATAYFERRVICGTDTAYTNMATITIGTPPSASSLNFVRTRTIVKPLVTDTVTADNLTSPIDVQQTTQYLDDLGRPVQTVSRQITPRGNDLVQVQVYDPFGREAVHYLPYAATTADGNYKPSALASLDSFNTTQYPGEQYYYGQTDFEAAPLNRTLTSYAPGSSWVGSGRGVGSAYEANGQQDSVAIWNIAMAQGSIPTMAGFYPAGQLYRNITTDESGHQVIEYKDKEGELILKKVQLADIPGTAHAGWLCTYYVYDNLNDLRFVLSPQAVGLINRSAVWTVPQAIADALCFRYEYDSRQRLIIKKVPGAGETHLVYDVRDRLVMSQDSMLRSTEQWLVTTYDPLNRPDSVGLMTDPSNFNTLSFHTNAAMQSPTYPPIQNYPVYSVQVQTHYDNYAWVTALNNVLTATMDTSFNGNSAYFITNYNSSPAYAVPLTPFPISRGEVTGTTKYLLGTNNARWEVNFYDDRERTIEVQSTNFTNGLDKDITQYDFSGKPLRHLLVTKKNGTNGQTHTVSDQYTYDAAFRPTGVKDNIDGTLITVDTLQYDELGQLQKKTLGGGLDSEVYAYNIRGWVTGINKNYIAGTVNDYFGMEIGYDKRTSVSTTTYAAAQFTGNITGFIWKSAGDGLNRKYDFTYDNSNRFAGADFLQNPSGSTWNTTVMDYTVGNVSYDANGNLMTLNQRGFKVGAATSALIDQLTYAYQSNSNQLSQVIDRANDTASTLGDFHYKTKGAFDYTYDGNGSLKIDNNKGIDSIGYNYLNLPQYIHINGKGLIQYVYDTKGEKQAKIVTDSTQTPVKVTTTDYIKTFQYTNDTLAQFNFAEGRARWQKKYLVGGDSITGYFYDYFMKDHLGNTRVILTTQKDTAQYIATMEPANRATENALFYNIDSTSFATNAVPGGYPGGTNGGANDSVAMVSGSVGGHTQGPALLLKVMSGDSISIGVNSYYVGGGSAGSTTSSLPSVLNTIAGGLVALGGGSEHTALAALDNTGGPVYTALNSFMPVLDTTPTTNKPKAYLNWMLVDNQFNYVSGNGQSGALPVGNPNVLNALATTIKLQHSGYLYIWVSNETQNWDVFFDNLSIQDFTGPMLEETHYYPFGLTMVGISDKALKANYAENKYRWNKGSELQNKEFSDGAGLEMYETPLRSLDPQLGRWWQIDSKPTEAESPYSAMGNNPILKDDPFGDTLAVSGKQDATDLFKKIVNNGTGGFYSTKIDDKTGNVNLVSTGKEGEMTNEQKAFYDEINGIIDDDRGTVNISLVTKSDDFVGDVDKGPTLNIKDINAFGDGKIASAQSVLAHEFVEQKEIQLSHLPYETLNSVPGAHQKGIDAEERITGYKRDEEGVATMVDNHKTGHIAIPYKNPTTNKWEYVDIWMNKGKVTEIKEGPWDNLQSTKPQ
jgi:hypothetical protein